MSSTQSKVWFTGSQIVQAIEFHLKNEGWFVEIPPGLIKWLRDQLPDKSKYSFNKVQWEDHRTGTQRMLWLMISTKIDPFELCKWTKNPQETGAMHRRFSNIISSWYPESKTVL